MYLAVVGLIFGQALIFASADLIAYAIFIALCFIVFVLYYEEPRLRVRFGAQYEDYANAVPRWRPRFKAWTPDDED